MNYEDAKRSIHVRSSLRRRSKPGELYPKNHDVPFDDRVSLADQNATDWEEFDPREQPECSEFDEVPA